MQSLTRFACGEKLAHTLALQTSLCFQVGEVVHKAPFAISTDLILSSTILKYLRRSNSSPPDSEPGSFQV